MKRYFTILMVCMVSMLAAACSDDSGCYPLRCDPSDTSVECKQPIQKIPYTSPDGGATTQLGIISYIVTVIQDTVQGSSQKIFEHITADSSYQKVVTASMILFVAMYGIAIALGIAQPSPLELVMRVTKMIIIFYLLTSWANFQGIVVNFFESLTNGLSNIFTTAVVDSASGVAGGTTITAMDVFGFIDDKVLGTLLSVRFAVIVGAVATISGVGIIVSLLLASIIFSYLWTLVLAVQIYIMASIARALLYAVSPLFLIFLLFSQTKPLFESWLKQLINFSLQPVLLVGFLAFFNGIFFNYLDTMFEPGYQVCSGKRETTGQVVNLSEFYIAPVNPAAGVPVPPKPNPPIPLVEVMDMFTLFVVIMLGFIMIKMNQWAVQAAAQLSEGGITFTQTLQGSGQFANSVTSRFGNTMRGAVGLTSKGK